MIKTETAASKLRYALQQLYSLSPNSGISPEHIEFARSTITTYLRMIENKIELTPHTDLNRVPRLVIEYWPLTLPAGDAVVAAEHAMRKLARK